ncbi:unnamed protein product [Lathyrus oleraceus]|uniref:Response regulatory domain-containing protein n=1 Tax=Pisum sativum TaxID=3888 RepID=A0A9D4XTI9_PEA|nr:two-component response regulator 24-like [Pisum sativum]KAI5426198.1 hypothetical protein KIW84_031867 [Pisum sativum]
MVATIEDKGKQKMVYDSEDDDLAKPPPRIVRALVVENDDRIRKIHEKKLKQLGVETRSVKTGREAIEKICVDEIYDLVLIRRTLPFMDGLEVTKMLRKMEYPTTIAGVSQPLTDLEKIEFYSAGLDICIDNETPLTRRTLEFIVKTVSPRKTWKQRSDYLCFLIHGPPSGPGSSSTSKNVCEED